VMLMWSGLLLSPWTWPSRAHLNPRHSADAWQPTGDSPERSVERSSCH
jgi:hypothetical protein